jgi:hypothetical protein
MIDDGRHLQILFIFFIVLCLAFKIPESGAQEIQIYINSNDKQLINPDLYGISTENLFFNFDISDDAYAQLVSSLKCRIFRFPGGGISSIFHWDGTGYGIIKEEAQEYGLEKRFLKQEELNSQISYTDAFIKLVKITDARALIVANILTDSPDRFVRFLQYLSKNGINPVGIELGSEMYLKKWRQKIGNINEYIKRAKSFAISIKEAYPDLKVGVVAAPSPLQNRAAYFMEWNSLLANDPFYDAYIIHPYLVIQHCDKKDDLVAQFNCAHDKASKFLSEKFTKILDYYTNLFGNEKKIWVTEWNISHFGNNGTYGNTNFQNLFAAGFLLNLINLTSYNPGIEYATYHNLSEKWLGFALINKRLKQEKFEPGATYLRRAAYFAFFLLKDIFVEGSYRLKSKIQSLNDDGGAERLQISTFQINDMTFIYLLNHTDKSVALKNIYQNLEIRDPDEYVEFMYVYGNTLYASRGLNNIRPVTKEDLYFCSDTTRIVDLKLRPYSLSLIKLIN